MAKVKNISMIKEIREENGVKYTVFSKENGTYYYYKYGTKLLHREHGPAVSYRYGAQEWWLNGVRHREDGPAILAKNYYFSQWWYHGKRIKTKSQKDFECIIKFGAAFL